MRPRPRPLSKAISYLSEEIATQFCQKLTKSNPQALIDDAVFNQALEHLLEEVWHIREAKRQEILELEVSLHIQAALAAPSDPLQPGLPMNTRQVLQALNLVHEAQLQVACTLGWLRPIRTGDAGKSKQAMYQILVEYPLTPAQRQQLEKLTLLNQQQCADFLNVAYYRFIQIRDQYRLKDSRPKNHLFIGNARFYRLHDLLKIMPDLA